MVSEKERVLLKIAAWKENPNLPSNVWNQRSNLKAERFRGPCSLGRGTLKICLDQIGAQMTAIFIAKPWRKQPSRATWSFSGYLL